MTKISRKARYNWSRASKESSYQHKGFLRTLRATFLCTSSWKGIFCKSLTSYL